MELYHSAKAILTIDEYATRKLINCVLHNYTVEAGGVLLGKKKVNSDTYTITDIGLPTKYDQQEPMTFIRSKISARQAICAAWEQSEGIVNHIGEWHSHIFNSPFPSPQDRYDMQRAYEDGEFVFEHFFTVIVSRDLRIYTGLVQCGIIVDHNIIKVRR